MKHIAILIFATFLASCGSTSEVKSNKTQTINKKWELSVLNDNKISNNKPIYIDLSENGIISGFIGCNRLNGTYTIENENQIKFSQFAVTRMACEQRELDLENQILELLKTSSNFTIENGELNLNSENNKSIAKFIEMSKSEIVNKYWKLVTLDDKKVEMAPNQEREQYFILRSDNIFSGFAGCNQFSGAFELKENHKIRFDENIRVTMKACLDDNINEQDFLKIFTLADNYTINGDTLILKTDKNATLAVFQAVYF
ncbi:META domain-containing protein [Aequorivita sp. KMM 9714]|uniref:META domain-containing protein n=1 Tax=Aequorivita sp. KMM 9714 TaxID=2707173 RepID=UPI0013ED8275|nr:META domain-containing protein [Aequorivita sp. KMM 9714]NGX85302.1 META domain-containing protein [Aequorivita sp. KMM 9714]